jgi:hypothetical protein
MQRMPGWAASSLTPSRAVKQIQAFPESSPISLAPVRTKVLSAFPFSVIYWVTGDVIIVLAVAHHRRRPEDWRVRGQSHAGVLAARSSLRRAHAKREVEGSDLPGAPTLLLRQTFSPYMTGSWSPLRCPVAPPDSTQTLPDRDAHSNLQALPGGPTVDPRLTVDAHRVPPDAHDRKGVGAPRRT